jgi:hypothetical protein
MNVLLLRIGKPNAGVGLLGHGQQHQLLDFGGFVLQGLPHGTREARFWIFCQLQNEVSYLWKSTLVSSWAGLTLALTNQIVDDGNLTGTCKNF